MKKVNFSELNYSEKPLSTKEALSDVTPIALSDEVTCGNKQISVISAHRENQQTCVELEISY